jgi:hypothetical protein
MLNGVLGSIQMLYNVSKISILTHLNKKMKMKNHKLFDYDTNFNSERIHQTV